MGKIAVIDSGIGGLTVVKEIMKQMPQEQIVYFGDQKNCPYGDKSKEEIQGFVHNIIGFLSNFDIKALVIACNTATSVALDDIIGQYDFPIIGVIHPGATYALEQTKNKKIGVIATKKTIETKIYEEIITSLDQNARVYGVACPKIVPLLESETEEKEAIHLALEEYLFSFKETGIDTLILGCTHYPIIASDIQKIIGECVILADPAIRTVEALKGVLSSNYDKSFVGDKPQHLFFTSGDASLFNKKARKILGIPVCSKKEDRIFITKM